MSNVDEGPITPREREGLSLAFTNPHDASANDSFTIEDFRSPSPRQASVSFSSAGSCPLDYSAETTMAETSFGNFSPVSQDGDAKAESSTNEPKSSLESTEAVVVGEAQAKASTDSPDADADQSTVPAEISHISSSSRQSSDANKRNAKGQSALSISSSACFLDGMKLLIENGANINLQDRHSRTPLHLACENTESSLHHDCVKHLLANGANANVQDIEGRTPLHIAAKEGCAECINLLLEHGAVTDACDSAGNTPLHITATMGHIDCMEALSPNVGCDESHSSVESSPSFLFDDNEANGISGSFYQSPREAYTGKDSFRRAEDEPSLQANGLHNDSGYFTASGSGRGWVKRKYYQNDKIEEERESSASSRYGSSITGVDESESNAPSQMESFKDAKANKALLFDVLEIILRVIIHLLRSLLTLAKKQPKPGDSNYQLVQPPDHVAEAMERIKSASSKK